MKKPGSMSDEECGDLPVFKGTSGGYPCFISCWKLSKEDLEEIQRTGRIWLFIFGEGHPPVSVQTERPFPDQSKIITP